MSSLDNECIKGETDPVSRVLIVDDDEAISSMLCEFLEMQGFVSDTCKTGAETFDYLKLNPVDLILLDVKLPDIGGIEVAQRIRRDKNDIGFIPIIMVSAMDSAEDKIKGLQFADDYVTKPFSYNELLARIHAHLRIGQLQNELLLSKSRYQCLYENIPEICISLDRDRSISDCNTMFCEYFNTSKDAVIGKKVFEFFTPEDHNELIAYFNKLEPQKIRDNAHIFRLSSRDNDPVFVSIRAVCLGEHETGLYIIVAMKDVSTNVQLETQQKLARQQLYRSARLASIGTLASGTAHEMNNPLAAILGFSDALLHRFDEGGDIDDEELNQYLGIIKSEALRCRDVVENLSKFARDYESQIEKVSLFDCLHSSIKLMNARALKKNIQIVNSVGSDIIINTDAQKIGQVLVNILSNSIDFCEDGSTLTIEMVRGDERDNPIQLKIIDNGPGIPENVLPKIFDPFFTTKEVGKGVGLGMSISYKLMEECGGSIDVTSKENKGTTVTLVIPRN